jgi:hypothetical protein
VDLHLTPGEHVLRCDVANRAVQADVILMLDVALHQTPWRVAHPSRRNIGTPTLTPFQAHLQIVGCPILSSFERVGIFLLVREKIHLR